MKEINCLEMCRVGLVIEYSGKVHNDERVSQQHGIIQSVHPYGASIVLDSGMRAFATISDFADKSVKIIVL